MKEDKKSYLAGMDLKALREQHKERIDRAREQVKEHNRIMKAVQEALKKEPSTVPALAAAIGMETETVMKYVSTLKKYGTVGEGSKDGDYFTYQLMA
jgi:Fic family protein